MNFILCSIVVLYFPQIRKIAWQSSEKNVQSKEESSRRTEKLVKVERGQEILEWWKLYWGFIFFPYSLPPPHRVSCCSIPSPSG